MRDITLARQFERMHRTVRSFPPVAVLNAMAALARAMPGSPPLERILIGSPPLADWPVTPAKEAEEDARQAALRFFSKSESA